MSTSIHPCQVAGCDGAVTFVHGIASAVGNDALMNHAQCDPCGAEYVRSVETGEVFMRPGDYLDE